MNGAPTPPPPPLPDDSQLGKRCARRRLVQLVASKFGWFRRLSATSTFADRCLYGTLLVGGALTLILAVGDLAYVNAVYDWLGVALLFLIASANLAAIALSLSEVYEVAWSVVAAFLAQSLVLALAGYVLFIDIFKSPKSNTGIMLVAMVIGFVALIWCVVLFRRTFLQLRPFIRTAALIGVLVPLTGLLQFYLQNYYAPHVSAPLVDVSAELIPQSESNSRIHLSAKVTVHNRGSARISTSGSLMRLTAYPTAAHPQKSEITSQQQGASATCGPGTIPTERWCEIGSALSFSGRNPQSEYRAEATPAPDAQVLYAAIFMPYGSDLAAGETDTFQRVVDIDPATVRLVRLSVSAVFLTQRNIKDRMSCAKPRVSDQNPNFAEAVDTPQHFPDLDAPSNIDARTAPNIMCVDYEFAPQNIIDKLIGNQGACRVEIVLNNPGYPDSEYPVVDPICHHRRERQTA